MKRFSGANKVVKDDFNKKNSKLIGGKEEPQFVKTMNY